MTAPLQKSKKKLWAQPPRTAMEVYEMLPEGTRCEVINNTLYMPPCPSIEHQNTNAQLGARMRIFADDNMLGMVLFPPTDIHIDGANICQPDILFVEKNNLSIIKNGKILGPPNLVVEFLSPGNRSHDLKRKFALYEQFGVTEYFIIDPLTKDVLHYVLTDGKYQSQPATKGRMYSKVLGTSFSF